MKNMKRTFLIAYTLIMGVLLGSCQKEKSFSFVMSEVNPAGSLSVRMDEAFVQKVQELSEGSITIQLYTDGVLGDNTEVTNVMLQAGSKIDIARISPATLSTKNCNKHMLLDVPFTFSGHEHFQKFAKSPLAEKILNEPYENKLGIKGLFFAEEGFRHFFSTKKLTSVADFNGKKIRTAGNSVMQGIIDGLKGISVTVNFSNLYTALQTGSVEIAEQPIANYLSNHFNKIAPYMILDGHQLGITEVVITAEAWDSLSEKQKQIFIEASRYAQEECFKMLQEIESQNKLILQSEGTEFIEVKDISAWQTACADIINQSVTSDAGLYGEIITLAD